MNNPMTLVERLRNPAWTMGPLPTLHAPPLDEEQTINDMREAADEIERLRAPAASSFVPAIATGAIGGLALLF